MLDDIDGNPAGRLAHHEGLLDPIHGFQPLRDLVQVDGENVATSHKATSNAYLLPTESPQPIHLNSLEAKVGGLAKVGSRLVGR